MNINTDDNIHAFKHLAQQHRKRNILVRITVILTIDFGDSDRPFPAHFFSLLFYPM